MNRSRHLRTLAVHRIALVCAVAVTLVVSRTAAISVPRASLSHKSAVQCQSVHPKRQTLDQNGGFDFSLVAQTPFFSPSLVSYLCPSCTDEPLLPLQPDSYHHNRPPPLL